MQKYFQVPEGALHRRKARPVVVVFFRFRMRVWNNGFKI